VTIREPSDLAGKTVKIRDDVPMLGGEIYRVEDWWTRVTGGESWMDAQVPAAFNYAVRTAGLVPIDDDVLYGKVGSFGHLVHVSEIEAIA
jgi:hypothetical protein